MATAPVVIPGALTQLASGVALNAATTALQVVYTAPNGLKCQPLFVVFYDASTAVNAATTVSAGNSAVSTTTYLNASAVLQSMLTTTGAIVLPVYGSSVAAAVAKQAGSNTFTVTFGGTLTSNGTVKCDVIGQLGAI